MPQKQSNRGWFAEALLIYMSIFLRVLRDLRGKKYIVLLTQND